MAAQEGTMPSDGFTEFCAALWAGIAPEADARLESHGNRERYATNCWVQFEPSTRDRMIRIGMALAQARAEGFRDGIERAAQECRFDGHSEPPDIAPLSPTHPHYPFGDYPGCHICEAQKARGAAAERSGGEDGR